MSISIAVKKTILGTNIFYVVLDCVIGNMTNRYDSIYALESMFGFLWKYLKYG